MDYQPFHWANWTAWRDKGVGPTAVSLSRHAWLAESTGFFVQWKSFKKLLFNSLWLKPNTFAGRSRAFVFVGDIVFRFLSEYLMHYNTNVSGEKPQLFLTSSFIHFSFPSCIYSTLLKILLFSTFCPFFPDTFLRLSVAIFQLSSQNSTQACLFCTLTSYGNPQIHLLFYLPI